MTPTRPKSSAGCIRTPVISAGARDLAALAMLTHFTRAAGRLRAIDNLIAILGDGEIRASGRMIAGRRPVVCLCDAALGELSHIVSRANRRRYEPFGIALDRRYAFRMGARPVLYMPRREAGAMLPKEEAWRVAVLELDRTPPLDWSYEREWRVPGNLPLPGRKAVALVADWRDADEVYDRFGGDPPCSGVIPIKELIGLA